MVSVVRVGFPYGLLRLVNQNSVTVTNQRKWWLELEVKGSVYDAFTTCLTTMKAARETQAPRDIVPIFSAMYNFDYENDTVWVILNLIILRVLK